MNKISSYIVKFFFSHLFSIMCAISLYWFCTLGTSKVSLRFVRFHVASFIYLFSFCFWPLSKVFFFLGKLMCGCPRGLMRGTGSEFSGMSSKWFLHVMLLMWGYPSAHCITKISVTIASLSAIMFKNADLHWEWKSVIMLSRTRFRWKRKKNNFFFFHLRIYKYLLTQFTVERGLCVYILIKEYASLWAEQKYFAG